MSASIVIATSLLMLLWSFVDHLLIGIWYALVLFLALERIYNAFKGCRYGDKSLEARYQRFRIEAVMMAGLWSFAAFVFYPEGHFEYELLLALIIAGMAGGGAITLGIDRRIADTYILMVLSPLALRFLMCADKAHFILFVMTLVFMVIFMVSTRQLSKILEKGIRQHGELDEIQGRLNMILDQTPTGIFYYDRNFRIVDCNQAFSQLLKVEKEKIVGLDLNTLEDRNSLKILRQVIDGKRTLRYDGPYKSMMSHREIWVSAVVAPLIDPSERILGAIAVIEDKTNEHKALEKAEFLAFHDALTSLPNRKLLGDRYTLQVAQAERKGSFSALLFLDLDRFKHVNDTYGHKIGDELLKETAARLKEIFRRGDTVCRLGGDEFIIFLPMISSDLNRSIDHTSQVAKKIHKELAQPYEIDGHQLFISTSIGAVMIGGSRETLDEVLRCADIAMYHAKKMGRGVTSFYEVEMDEKIKTAIRMEHDLRHAIDRNELKLFFQPIVDIRTEEIYGAETLLRWHHSSGKMISPADFIPVAEESKLIHQIGRWVIKEACRKIGEWSEKGRLPIRYVSINLSSKQLAHGSFFDETMAAIRDSGIDPKCIKFEITESVLMDESEQTQKIISRFNREGIGFLIDDFGTGYSSLSYLKRFKFESIKIDKSFIHDILSDEDDVALVRAILDIAKQFDYRVIAEGVESEAQRKKLEEMDRNMFYQGYLFSKPLDADRFAKMLKGET
ncbi:putative bifunctional diguanylate cyclase/phosphodiesterase [Hydrogenimonas cancrithermarum]|nr:GGDEF and EAL domain-containing protein [Hydrogenimonas cancrithermarum]